MRVCVAQHQKVANTLIEFSSFIKSPPESYLLGNPAQAFEECERLWVECQEQAPAACFTVIWPAIGLYLHKLSTTSLKLKTQSSKKVKSTPAYLFAFLSSLLHRSEVFRPSALCILLIGTRTSDHPKQPRFLSSFSVSLTSIQLREGGGWAPCTADLRPRRQSDRSAARLSQHSSSEPQGSGAASAIQLQDLLGPTRRRERNAVQKLPGRAKVWAQRFRLRGRWGRGARSE